MQHLGVTVPFLKSFPPDDEETEDRWVQEALRGRNADGRALEAQCPGYCSCVVSVSREAISMGRSIDMIVECVPPRQGREWRATYRLEVRGNTEGETPTQE